MIVTWIRDFKGRTRFRQMVARLMDAGCSRIEAEEIAAKRLKEEQELKSAND